MVLFIDEFDAVARDRRFTLDFFDNLWSCASVLPLTSVVVSVAPRHQPQSSGCDFVERPKGEKKPGIIPASRASA
jgi:hypothetical protein